jgi:hypothetical protein
MTPWWTEEMAGLIGGIGGGGLGTLGGLLGAAAGMLVPRGIGKRFILGSFGALAGVGAIALGAGIVGIAMGQPYYVWYPLLLGGLILSLVMGSLLPVMILGYRKMEARRMHAEDLRRG